MKSDHCVSTPIIMEMHKKAIMGQTSVNIRELNRRLSHYLQQVKARKTVEVTERGTPVSRIIPTSLPVEDRIGLMVQASLLLWNKRKIKPMLLVARVRGKRSVADLLIGNRK